MLLVILCNGLLLHGASLVSFTLYISIDPFTHIHALVPVTFQLLDDCSLSHHSQNVGTLKLSCHWLLHHSWYGTLYEDEPTFRLTEPLKSLLGWMHCQFSKMFWTFSYHFPQSNGSRISFKSLAFVVRSRGSQDGNREREDQENVTCGWSDKCIVSSEM